MPERLQFELKRPRQHPADQPRRPDVCVNQRFDGEVGVRDGLVDSEDAVEVAVQRDDVLFLWV